MQPAPYSVAPASLRELQTRHPGSLRGRRCHGRHGRLPMVARNDVCPDKLTFVMPRLADRPSDAAAGRPGGSGKATVRLSRPSGPRPRPTIIRLETAGTCLRIDPRCVRAMYRFRPVSCLELEQLRRIRDIVRMGHVQRTEPTTMSARRIGSRRPALYIDCTDGAPQRPAKPVFRRTDHLTLQAVRDANRYSAPRYRARRIRRDRGEKRTLYPDSTPGHDLGWMRLMRRSRQLSALVKRPRS